MPHERGFARGYRCHRHLPVSVRMGAQGQSRIAPAAPSRILLVRCGCPSRFKGQDCANRDRKKPVPKRCVQKVLAAFGVSSDRSQGLGGPLLGSSRPREFVALRGGRCQRQTLTREAPPIDLDEPKITASTHSRIMSSRRRRRDITFVEQTEVHDAVAEGANVRVAMLAYCSVLHEGYAAG